MKFFPIAPFFFVVLVSLMASKLHAQTTLIPDPVFEQYLIDQGWDSDGVINGEVATTDIETVTHMHMSEPSYPLTSLSGLEDFTALVSLNVHRQPYLPSINVTQNPALEELIFYDSYVTTVDVSQNPLLRVFDAFGTRCGNMDFTNNPWLEIIDMESSYANDITLGTHPNLTYLSLVEYGGSDGLITALDLTACTNLEFLKFVDQTALTTIDLSNNTQLETVIFRNCGLVELDLSAAVNLTSAKIYNSTGDGVLAALNLRNGNNALLTGVDQVNISGNPNLLCLQVDDATAAHQDAGAYSTWLHDPEVIFAEQNCNLTYVPDDVFEQYMVNQGWDDMVNDYVLTDRISGQTHVAPHPDNEPVSNVIGLEGFAALEVLDLHLHTDITSVDVSQNAALREVYIYDSSVGTMDVSNNPELRVFDAQTGACGSMDFTQNPLMELINMNYTHGTDIYLGTHPYLQYLAFEPEGGGSYMSSLDLSSCVSLNYLWLRQLPEMTSLDLSSNVNLETLYLDDCGITDLDLSHNSNLTELRLNAIYAPSPLSTLNLRNGNNASMVGSNKVQLTGLPNLQCVVVDDALAAAQDLGAYADWQHDVGLLFSDASCALTYVPDDAFEQALIDQGVDNFLDDYVDTENMAVPTSLVLNDVAIADFTGLEAMTNLTELRINGIDGNPALLDPSLLASLPQLLTLELLQVNLTANLDAGLWPNMHTLHLNLPSSSVLINIMNNAALEDLAIQGPQITDIATFMLPVLRVLEIGPTLYGFPGFYMNDSPLLESFYVFGHPELVSVNVDGCPLLHTFRIEDCGSAGAGMDLDLSANPNLTEVSLFPNTLGADLSKINSLNLQNGNNAILTTARIDSSEPWSCLLVDDGPAARAGTGAYANWEVTPGVYLASNCSLTYIPDDALEQNLIYQGADDMLDDYAFTEALQAVTHLSFSWPYMEDFTGMEDMVNLEYFYLESGPTIDMDPSLLTHWPQLTTLHLNRVRISGLADFSSNPLLTHLTYEEAPFNFDLSACSQLASLNIWTAGYGNPGDTFILGNHPNLTNVSIEVWDDFNQTTQLDFSSCPQLTNLYLRGYEELQNLHLTGCTNLSSLRLYSMALQSSGLDLDLSGFPNLTDVHTADDNYVESLIDVSKINSVNLQNGNNDQLIHCGIWSTVPIQCILVDDEVAANARTGSYTTWLSMESITFSEDCDLIYLPDDGLEEALIQMGLDVGMNDYITQSAALAVTHILDPISSVYDFTGMEYMVNLEVFQRTYGASANLSPDMLANWPKLHTLNIRNVRIQGFCDFSGTPLLSNLVYEEAPFNFDLSACPLLDKVTISTYDRGNPNDRIVLGNLPNLTTFELFNFADENTTTSMDFSTCPQLERIFIYGQEYLEEINLDGCSNLDFLYLYAIGTLSSGPGLDLDLTDCTSLNHFQTADDYIYPTEVWDRSKVRTVNLKNGLNAQLNNPGIFSSIPIECIAVDDATSAAALSGDYADWNVEDLAAFTEHEPGCLDPAACNYNPDACSDNGSCTYPDGCTDPLSCNYDPTATCDDGSCTTPPANDFCAQAVALTAGVSVVGNNTFACNETIATPCSYDNLVNDVWYSYTPTTPGEITVFTTLSGTMTDSRIAVFDACGGAEVYCNDDAISGDLSSRISFFPECGMTYLIQASAFNNGHNGSFEIQLDQAEVVVQCNDPLACNYTACTTDASGCVYPGCTNPQACNYDASAACDDGSCTGAQAITQELCVYENEGDCVMDGSDICVNDTEYFTSTSFSQNFTGETWVELRLLTGFMACQDGTTLTVDVDGEVVYTEFDASCFCRAPSEIILDHTQLPALVGTDHTITFSFDSFVFLSILTATAITSDVRVNGCTDPASPDYNPAATCDDGSCTYPPANDFCSQAVPLTAGVAVTSDNTFAVNESADTPCAWGYVTNDVWFSYTATSPGDITVYTILNGTLGDSRMGIFDACGGNELHCNDDVVSEDYSSSITFTPVCGQTYYIQVASYSDNDNGSFDIQLDQAADTILCNDPTACNYSPCSLEDTGCVYPGCTNPESCNYDPLAGCDDGTCQGAQESTTHWCLYDYDGNCQMDGSDGCYNGADGFPGGISFTESFTAETLTDLDILVVYSSCTGSDFIVSIDGEVIYSEFDDTCHCPLPRNLHFDHTQLPALLGTEHTITFTLTGWVEFSFLSADLSTSDAYQAGCTDPAATNFNTAANCDDGSCSYTPLCAEDLNADGQIGTSDLLVVLGVFGSECAPAEPCPVDLDGSGQVGTGDLLEILGVFGTSCP